MWNDFFAKNALVPFLLRVVLAVIFLFTGWQKIADRQNDWGALWATHLKSRDVDPPPEVLARLHQFLKEKENLLDNPTAEQRKAVMSDFIADLSRQEGESTNADQKKSIPLPPDIEDRIRGAYAQTAGASLTGGGGTAALELNSSVQLLVAWGELIGGIALLLGVLTRWAALGLVIIQVGAIYMVTWAQGFSSLQGGGYGYNIALIAMLLALVLLGGGLWSLDQLLPWGRKRAARKTAEMAAV
jgi:putative oxidoreductase